MAQFILRRPPPGAGPRDSAMGQQREAAVIELADCTGRGFASERIAGETLPRRLLRDAVFAAGEV